MVPLAVLIVVGALVVRALPGEGVASTESSGQSELVFAEFGSNADQIYTAPAADPTRRTLVATVEHAEGWGINPAPAMAGSLVAYTVLPASGSTRRDAQAELWLLDVSTRMVKRLARDADLLVAPIFDQAGRFVAYRSSRVTGEQRLLRVDLESGVRHVEYAYSGTFGVYPVGFTNEGALLFAGLSTAGTDLYLIRDGRDHELILHASDDIARDWRLSPNGESLSYLEPQRSGERIVHRLRVIAVNDGMERRVSGDPSSSVEQFAPVWTPNGNAVTVGLEAYPALSSSAVTISLSGGEQILAGPERGFDAPLGWSVDGRYLAARTFDGTSSFDPGRESFVVISADGSRRPIGSRGELIFLGWLISG